MPNSWLNNQLVKLFLHNTWCAVNRLLGSRTSIFLTKSFALSEIEGQGSEEKSRSPRRTCSNIPCSFSTQPYEPHKDGGKINNHEKRHKFIRIKVKITLSK